MYYMLLAPMTPFSQLKIISVLFKLAHYFVKVFIILLVVAPNCSHSVGAILQYFPQQLCELLFCLILTVFFSVALRFLGNGTDDSRTLGPAWCKGVKEGLVAVSGRRCMILSREAQIHISKFAHPAKECRAHKFRIPDKSDLSSTFILLANCSSFARGVDKRETRNKITLLTKQRTLQNTWFQRSYDKRHCHYTTETKYTQQNQ